ncbi:lantibiotic dehydratase [Paenibacillus thiaminolyticus]|uniref:Lantibiotic dehydratase n=1 Tax=Paenibacillus thiaminolyticus TaxID=49283 RepID=A0AAP9DS44_PANTH|nr:lantibiotic dehydratase [Paenibacillus thiaminolyticus]MCY9601642.1 lantibiotic dehydratase [Paenibacillus thiaminolyticus]MCY9610679.1 lantibiotic dehydratase [Paenibacillus thiaminolyticus]MCY9616008.1 lantibiotic dehydratase [Paenibacillus thiaminolyticus]MCY9622089.1 lantibiotic dehydratase [Paenibacillus thiaminolyticus]MCY9625738.1 lantibiotic dehydratase [Paenibacillus thiaminolyticus]
MIKEAQYRVLDFFMIRTPIISIDNFINLFPEECSDKDLIKQETLKKVITLTENSCVREAIAVSSESLYNSLSILKEPNIVTKKKDQVLNSFLRYMIRMMTRPTPFGLFSGVTYGHFSDIPQLNICEVNSYRKRARPDMQWLLKVVKKIEADKKIVSQLRVQFNFLVFIRGSRAKIDAAMRYGKLKLNENDSVSVRINEAFHFVMESSKEPILYSELVHLMRSKFCDADFDAIDQYIWNLFEQEFIISELRMPSTTIKPFEKILSILNDIKGIDGLVADLKKISQMIKKYNETEIGSGEMNFFELQEVMKKIETADNVLQVDLSLEDKSLTLPKRVKEDVGKAANILCRMAPSKNQHLAEYCNEFIEKYGPYREVPLLELLDEETGLGPPATYRHPRSNQRKIERKESKYEAKLEELLFNWSITCIRSGEEEIILTDEMLEQIGEDELLMNDKTSPSMELYFKLVSDSIQKLSNGKYNLILGRNPGSEGAGKSFGRFIDILGKDFQEKLRTVYQEEQNLEPSKIFAEISYLPSSGRITNVILTENQRMYEIPLGTSSYFPEDRQILVSDLLVGVRNNHFYIKSIRHNCEVIPTAAHMLNYELASNIYRFLIEVGQNQFRHWSNIHWGKMNSSPYIPRLRYDNIVLSPATWNVNVEVTKDQKGTIEEFFHYYKDKWKVPRYVYLTDADNQILLDIENPLHLEMLCRELQKNRHIILTECFEVLKRSPLQQINAGTVAAEFVFPMVRTAQRQEETHQEKKTAKIKKINFTLHERVYPPGGEWVYFKLYGLGNRQDEFIGRHWEEFLELINGYSQLAYFIRYADPQQHLRIRFKISKGEYYKDLMNDINQWSVKLLKDGMITKITFDTYEPEIERYGGYQSMRLAEELFAIDSLLTAQLVHLIRFNKTNLDIETIAILSVIELFHQFEYTNENMLLELNKYFELKDHLPEFRNRKGELLKMFVRKELYKEQPYAPLLESFNSRSDSVKNYKRAIDELKSNGELMNTFDDIVFSVIHMHLNRLLGLDRDLENKIMTLVRHAVNSFIQYRRNCK